MGWLQGSLPTAESISRDYFRNGVQLAKRLQLFDNKLPDLGRRRQAFADELAGQVARLDELRKMSRAAGQSGTGDRLIATTGA